MQYVACIQLSQLEKLFFTLDSSDVTERRVRLAAMAALILVMVNERSDRKRMIAKDHQMCAMRRSNCESQLGS